MYNNMYFNHTWSYSGNEFPKGILLIKKSDKTKTTKYVTKKEKMSKTNNHMKGRPLVKKTTNDTHNKMA